MDILLNDDSMIMQFTDESFSEYMLREVLPIMKQLEKISADVFKEYSTYSRKITTDKTLLEFIHERGNPIVEKFKSYLVQLSNEDPYWNDSVKTKTDTEYICDIAEIPNCITEAYERKGILFSFMNADYDHKWVSITCDKKRENVRNFTHHAELKEHLKELGLIMSWDSNSFFVNSIGYKFEVRFNEEHHNRAHFHLSNADEQISLSIPDADVLAGKVSNQPKVISWSLQNMKYIVELWNKYHPDRSV